MKVTTLNGQSQGPTEDETEMYSAAAAPLGEAGATGNWVRGGTTGYGNSSFRPWDLQSMHWKVQVDADAIAVI